MRDRNLRAFAVASGISNLADGLYVVAIPLLAALSTDSPAMVAGVSVAFTLPWVLFGLHAGVLADRLDRRLVMFSSHLLRASALALAAIAWLAGIDHLLMLYALAFTLGACETLADTAAAAMPPALVPRERLGQANSRLVTTATVTNSFIGPALGGLLVTLSAGMALGASAILYASAAVGIAILAGPFRAERPSASGVWRDAHDGVVYLWRHKLLRRLAVSTASMNLLWGAWAATFVLFAVEPGPLRLSPAAYGVLMTAMGVGGVLGSLLATTISDRVGLRVALTADFLGTMAIFALPLTSEPLLAALAIALGSFGAGVWVVVNATLRQQLVPDALLARTYGAHRLLSWGSLPLGAAVAGTVAELIGVRGLFIGATAASVVLLGGWLRWALPAIGTASIRAASPG